MSIANPKPVARIHRCDRWPDKIQHRDLESAFAEVDRVKEQRGVQLHVYACSTCGYFHLSKSSGKPGTGYEDINIGRKVHRKDIALWTASTDGKGGFQPPERDERFTGPRGPRGEAIEACRAALRAHGNPDTVKAVVLGGWAGITRDRATKALVEMGWVPTGATKSRVWHRTAAAAEQAEADEARTVEVKQQVAAEVKAASAPVQPEWTVIDLNAVKDVTVDQLIRVYKTAGKYLELRVRAR